MGQQIPWLPRGGNEHWHEGAVYYGCESPSNTTVHIYWMIQNKYKTRTKLIHTLKKKKRRSDKLDSQRHPSPHVGRKVTTETVGIVARSQESPLLRSHASHQSWVVIGSILCIIKLQTPRDCLFSTTMPYGGNKVFNNVLVLHLPGGCWTTRSQSTSRRLFPFVHLCFHPVLYLLLQFIIVF